MRKLRLGELERKNNEPKLQPQCGGVSVQSPVGLPEVWGSFQLSALLTFSKNSMEQF